MFCIVRVLVSVCLTQKGPRRRSALTKRVLRHPRVAFLPTETLTAFYLLKGVESLVLIARAMMNEDTAQRDSEKGGEEAYIVRVSVAI
jgi:hypothetical protein